MKCMYLFPANTVRFHPTDKPSITARIKQLIKERQQAFHAGDAQLWRLYTCKVQSEIKARKRKFYEEKVRNTRRDDFRQWWRTVNVMSGRTYSQSCFTLEARRRCPVGRRTSWVSKSVLRNRSCWYSTTWYVMPPIIFTICWGSAYYTFPRGLQKAFACKNKQGYGAWQHSASDN